MSPAATRRYRVSCIDLTEHETFVLALSEQDAVAKAVAIYNLNGLAEFTSSTVEKFDWEAVAAEVPHDC
ncbi:hypothetical protein WI604_03835 [Bradyrhizobium symbiodeficiens]|uniref:hypothetical protein n=1 Tax=Bradyrhizobium symbiodeficiens TaxID=1404367 RepID=UPI0030D461B9